VVGQSIAVSSQRRKDTGNFRFKFTMPNSGEPSGQRLSWGAVGLPADGVKNPRITGRELDLARWIS